MNVYRCMVVLLCCVVSGSLTQNLRTEVLSVSQYRSCLESPLAQDGGNTVPFDNQTPESQRTTNNTGTSCEQFGNQTVTVVVIQVSPLSARGGEVLTFNLKDVPNIGQTQLPGANQLACQNVPRGTQCQLLKDFMTISVESTEAFAAYGLSARANKIAFGYGTLVADNQVMNQKYDNSFSYVDTFACPKDDKWQDLYITPYSPADGNTLLAGICPTRENYCKQAKLKTTCDARYYTASNSKLLTNQCTTLYCRKPAASSGEQNKWKSIVTKTFGPECIVRDIDEIPKVAMNIRLNVNSTVQGTFASRTLVLGTLGGRTLASIDGLLIARIVKPNLSAQTIGSRRPGLIVACYACDPSQPDCARGVLNDLVTTDPFTLYNPFIAVNGPKFNGLQGCILPAAECRKRINGVPLDTFWYYVDPVRALREYNGNCNSNGFPEGGYVDPGVRARTCANSGRTVGGIPTTCVPGFRPPLGDDITNRFTYTPCQVSQIYSQILNYYTNNYDTKNIVLDYIPDGWTFNNPNCFIHNDYLYCNPIGQSNVGVQVALYIAGDLIGTVVPVAHGRFVDSSCVGNLGQSGFVGFSVENIGRTTGTFYVNAQFTVIKGGSVSSSEPSRQLQIRAGEVAISQIPFVYTGVVGQSLKAKLTLQIQSPTGDLVLVDEKDVTCLITQGSNRLEVIGESWNRLLESIPHDCNWYDFTCWDSLSVIDWIIRIFWMLVLTVVIGLLLYYSIKYCLRSQKLYRSTRKTISRDPITSSVMASTQ